MANITPRRDKNGNITSYTIRVYHGHDSSGKRLKPFTTSYKPEKGMTKKQAERAAQRFADEFESECLHFGEANSSMRLSDFVPRYLEIAKQTLSLATYEFYKLKIDSLINPALGHLKLKDINPSHIQKFINQLAAAPKEKRSGLPNKQGETLSPSTVRRYLTVLQSIFKQAVKLGLITVIARERSSDLLCRKRKRRKLRYSRSKRRRKCLPLSKMKIYSSRRSFSLQYSPERGAESWSR